MKHMEWLLCPICHNKTRIKIREDTELKKFPLYCPKCKQEILINVKLSNMGRCSRWWFLPGSGWRKPSA